MLSVSAVLLAVGALACSPRGERDGTTSPGVPATLAVPADFELRLRQTACFGSCPVYELEVHASGEVRFEGHAYTAVTGEASSFVAAERIAALVVELQRRGLASSDLRRPEHCLVVRDEGRLIVETTIDGRKVVVNSADYCEPAHAAPLFEFADHVLDLTGGYGWVHRVPHCRWRLDRRAAAALAADDAGVAAAAEGLATAVAVSFGDRAGWGVAVEGHRFVGERRRDARRRARRMADLLVSRGVPAHSIEIGTRRGERDTKGLVVDLKAPSCAPPG